MGVVDDYLADLDSDRRAVLTHVRDLVLTELPDAEQVISYRLPAFKTTKVVCGFAATKAGCSFYPFSGTVVAHFADRLADFSTTSGAIHFTPEAPLPDDLVRDMVAYRVDEIARRGR